MEAGRAERSSPGLRALRCPPSPCTPFPLCPAFFLHLTPEERAGKRLVLSHRLFLQTNDSHLSSSFSSEGCGKMTLLSTRPFPSFCFHSPEVHVHFELTQISGKRPGDVWPWSRGKNFTFARDVPHFPCFPWMEAAAGVFPFWGSHFSEPSSTPGSQRAASQ